MFAIVTLRQPVTKIVNVTRNVLRLVLFVVVRPQTLRTRWSLWRYRFWVGFGFGAVALPPTL